MISRISCENLIQLRSSWRKISSDAFLILLAFGKLWIFADRSSVFEKKKFLQVFRLRHNRTNLVVWAQHKTKLLAKLFISDLNSYCVVKDLFQLYAFHSKSLNPIICQLFGIHFRIYLQITRLLKFYNPSTPRFKYIYFIVNLSGQLHDTYGTMVRLKVCVSPNIIIKRYRLKKYP